MSDVWRCSICKKTKDLKGPHLHGKTSVRSDCWPCGKKTTFVKDHAAESSAAEAAAAIAPNPFASIFASTAATKSGRSAPSPANMQAAVPASVSAAPPTPAQTNAFHNIFTAATAAAAAAAASNNKHLTASVASADRGGLAPPSREGSQNAASSATLAPSGKSGLSRPSSNPFLTPAVSAASVKKFQTSYANAMTQQVKHDDANSTSSNGSLKRYAAIPTATSPASSSASASCSPYVMESAAGTSPPFTFRPKANYIAASSTTSLPASTNSTNPFAAGAAAVSPTGTPADSRAHPFGFSSRATPPSGNPAVTGTLPNSRSGSAAPQANASSSSTAAAAPAVATSAEAAPTHSLLVLPSSAAAPTAATAMMPVWMCEHCHKVKDLKGDHLKGKATVRSDCWPCARKRTFVFTTPDGKQLRSRGTATGSGQHPATFANTILAKSPGSAPPAGPVSASPAAATRAPALPAGASAKAMPWCLPTVPVSNMADGGYLLKPDASTVETTGANPTFATASAAPPSPAAINEAAPTMESALPSPWSFSQHAASVATVFPTATSAANLSVARPSPDVAVYYAAMARFDQQLLKSFREKLVRGTAPRAVWSGDVLYVITEGSSSDGATSTAAAGKTSAGTGSGVGNKNVVEAFAELGRFAALYLAVEQKLAGSRFRHIRRLFCPDEFSFAAACCYANNFFGAEAAAATTAASTASPKDSSRFLVYGPQTDPTKALSLWGRIVSQSTAAHPCIVSEEQRVLAAQTLYRRVSWLAVPQTMTATAIQLSLEVERKEGTAGDASESDVHGVDVVLLTGTVTLEELPQAVPLAQLNHPFA